MRCPYCGGLNPDTSQYCVRCGRNFTSQPTANAQQPVNQPQPTAYQPVGPRPYPPVQPARPVSQPVGNRPYPPVQPAQPARPVTPPIARPAVAPKPPQASPRPVPPATGPTAARRPNRHYNEPLTGLPPIPAAPEPPAPFPPRTFAQLKQLKEGALDYTVLNDEGGYGKKKIIRIAFRRCAPWQQVATLLKALDAYDNNKFDTLTIQGVYNQEQSTYAFTNGQLIFDRNVRLGSQTQQRFQIETDDGFSTEALRIVLAE
ncbi:hypothetical protein [Dictyobacter arantiisoli]|uniref:Zinc-ribbon domain-containing protein n=1 Tax=Dictyobacter arantiisoli TaxID=2014874 RepID=A0A5A5TKN6_9CHLR|nr:hypothetical protein [Dictyobacter arantiisoli]GCF11835.1 hypothetical protein KDI_53990 [Dictyobacter arantiisoli]